MPKESYLVGTLRILSKATHALFPGSSSNMEISVSFHISPSSADLALTATYIPPAHYISIQHSLLLQSPTHPIMLGLLGSQKEEIFM